MTSRRTLLIAAAAVATAALALAGCSGTASGGSTGSKGAPYKIGMSIDLSGPISFNGKVAAAGLQASVKAINDKGGVNGRTIDLETLDDASDVAKGKANFQQFVDEQRLAVFGYINSALSSAALPEATQTKTPIVALGGPTSSFDPVQPYFFSYELRADRLGHAILEQIATQAKTDKIDKPRIAIFAVDTASNHDAATAAAKEIAERGWTLTTTQFMPIAPTDVTAQASAIKSSNPDYVLMTHNDGGALVAVKGLRAAGVNAPVFNQWAGSSDSTFKALGAGYEAFRTYASPSQTDIPAIAAMAKTAKAEGFGAQMTNSYFTQGWVAGLILKSALQKCGTDCSTGAAFAKALDALGSFDDQNMSGPLTWNSTDHEMVKTVRFYGWSDSKNAVVADGDWVSAVK